MTDAQSHNRKYPRIPSRNSVLVKRLTGGEEELAKTQVVGLGGCSFVGEHAFGVSTLLEILIAVHVKVIRAVCRVAYERPLEGGRHEVGVEFVEIDPAERRLLESLWLDEPLPPGGDPC